MSDLQIAVISAVVGAFLGAILTIITRVLIDQRLSRRQTLKERSDNWLEKALNHADAVRDHIQHIRSEVTAPLGFDMDAISRAILRQLSNEDGPSPLTRLSDDEDYGDLKKYVAKAGEAWMAVRTAAMDDQHEVGPAQQEHDPAYAVQWYETALSNFAHAARKKLSS